MRSPTSLLAVVAAVLFGFLGVLTVRATPPDPARRLPAQYQLADLIQAEQARAARLRAEVASLRSELDRARSAGRDRSGRVAAEESRLRSAGVLAGVVEVRGPGLSVTLDDSTLTESPSGNVNDLVIHSQDVQAVVNALWRSGAEAVAINGQRLVGTSAVLCVGNTLLLNGTVHSPPYVVSAVGASRDRFDPDPLVRRLRRDADTYGLRMSVSRSASLAVPGYTGPLTLRYARPATP